MPSFWTLLAEASPKHTRYLHSEQKKCPAHQAFTPLARGFPASGLCNTEENYIEDVDEISASGFNNRCVLNSPNRAPAVLVRYMRDVLIGH